MALAIDIIYWRGPSNKVCHQLQSKKTNVRLYLPLILQQKALQVRYITSKREHGPCRRYNAWAWLE